ncbi:hypothetical protein AGMMS49928_01590 [Spirochaetia bacterium]|nr:hypothetical protein AGMMS49928_01590 [Spirochaetia bacterium]
MASEKKPSIYDDRSTIGSSSELDEYGVWIKSGPEDLSLDGGDISAGELDGLPDLDISEGFDAGTEPELDDFSLGDTTSGNLGDLSFDESLNLDNLDDLKVDFPVSDDQFDLPAEEPQASGGDGDADGDYDEISLDDFLGNPDESVNPLEIQDDDTPPDVEGSLPEESPESESFDTDLSLPDGFGEDTFEPEFSTPEASAPEKAGSPEISTQLLKQIAGELASIRNELSSLKEEFAQVRGGPSPEPKPAKDGAHGFFDEEDDEKIALTGDELNNIINTAEFIEETGEGLSNPDEVDILQNVEVKPVTPAPEDTTYLDESPLADESPLELDSSNLDLPAFDLDEQNISPDIPEETPADAADDPIGEISDDVTGDISLDDFPLGDDSAGEIVIDEAPAGEISLDDIGVGDTSVDDTGVDDVSIDDISAGDTGVGDISADDSSFEIENSLDLPAIDLDLEEADESLPDDAAGEETVEEAGEEDELDISLGDFPESPALEGVEAGEDLIPESFTEEIPDETAADDEKIPLETASFEPPPAPEGVDISNIPPALGKDLRTVLSYMDHLLESLPEEKIEEFAQSEYFDTYKKLFKELGLS